MARIVFCLPALPSHAAVHGALGRELLRRGHDCRFLGGDRLAPLARREGIPLARLSLPEAEIAGAGLVKVLWATAAVSRAWTRHGPEALASLAPDLVIVDQAEPGAALAAEAAGLPRASLASALPLDRDEAMPPPFVGWDWREGEDGRRRNRGGWRVADALMAAQARALAAGCRRHGLPVRARFDEWISETLDLRQMVPSLDFPHRTGPGARALGPLREGPAGECDLDTGGRPLVFASLGTLSGDRPRLLAAICAAAADLGIALALAHADRLTPREVAELPGNPIARALFPQRAVLARASACVTHAGLNTALDCAAARVPMVAIPLAFEQPATAARLAHHGVARVLPRRRATRDAIRDALAAVMGDPAYRAALDRPAAEIAAAGGTRGAADLVEAALAPAEMPGRDPAGRVEETGPGRTPLMGVG